MVGEPIFCECNCVCVSLSTILSASIIKGKPTKECRYYY